MATHHLVAAPDKFRGTASAPVIAQAIAAGAGRAGWSASCAAMADGGEGLLEAVGGEARTAKVTGPLGGPVEAEWRLLERLGEDFGPTAVIEMARASGLLLAGGREHNDPSGATTYGTGELIAAAVAAGARRVIVGCGGSATTDGGTGALRALEGVDLSGVELLIATDVTTPFLDAAIVFGPQKGASPALIDTLGLRLAEIAAQYQARFGLDVTVLSGAGAAGGLAGCLAMLGGRIVSGFDLVAELVHLDELLDHAELVVTGEGRFDASSLAGKVVGGVIERVRGRHPVLVVAGSVAEGLALPEHVEAVSLVERFGEPEAFARPAELVTEVVASYLACANPA